METKSLLSHSQEIANSEALS